MDVPLISDTISPGCIYRRKFQVSDATGPENLTGMSGSLVFATASGSPRTWTPTITSGGIMSFEVGGALTSGMVDTPAVLNITETSGGTPVRIADIYYSADKGR